MGPHPDVGEGAGPQPVRPGRAFYLRRLRFGDGIPTMADDPALSATVERALHKLRDVSPELAGALADPDAAARVGRVAPARDRSEEHTSEIQSLMRNSDAGFSL